MLNQLYKQTADEYNNLLNNMLEVVVSQHISKDGYTEIQSIMGSDLDFDIRLKKIARILEENLLKLEHVIYQGSGVSEYWLINNYSGEKIEGLRLEFPKITRLFKPENISA